MTGNSAKDLLLRPVTSASANAFIAKHHYSGKFVRNSQFHIGVFLNGRMEGAIQFGPPLDRRKLLGLVQGATWESVIELNRMAFTEALPRNSESRALGIAFRLLRKHAPAIRWVVSFADATQCGDGTIYRASGFVLTRINKSENLAMLPSGAVIHRMKLENNPARPRPELGGKSYFDVTGGKYDFARYCAMVNAQVLHGYQFRYIKFLDASWATRLTCPVIDFADIPEECRMYRGQRRLK